MCGKNQELGFLIFPSINQKVVAAKNKNKIKNHLFIVIRL